MYQDCDFLLVSLGGGGRGREESTGRVLAHVLRLVGRGEVPVGRDRDGDERVEKALVVPRRGHGGVVRRVRPNVAAEEAKDEGALVSLEGKEANPLCV